MDCEAYRISCKIDELTDAIGEVSWTESASVWIAGVAAFGTLSIAGLNIWLLIKQNKMHARALAAEQRGRRAMLGSLLKNEMIDWAVAYTTERKRTPSELHATLRAITEAIELSQEPSATLLNAYVAACKKSWEKGPRSVDGAWGFTDHVDETISAWVVDPSSFKSVAPAK